MNLDDIKSRVSIVDLAQHCASPLGGMTFIKRFDDVLTGILNNLLRLVNRSRFPVFQLNPICQSNPILDIMTGVHSTSQLSRV